MCGTGSLCCIPGIPADTCSSMEKKAQVQEKHNPSWNKQSRRRGACGHRIRAGKRSLRGGNQD